MRFRAFGTEFYISFLFAAVITAMLAFDRTGFILPLLFAVLIHELGHLTAMWILDCAPKRIRLVPAAVEITTKLQSGGKYEIFIALCGPAVNLLLFATLFVNYLAFNNDGYLTVGLINLLIGLFNLLPVTGLDGGTVLFNILCRKTEPSKAALIMRIINFSVALAALITAVTLCFKGQFNLSFFILALYLAVMSIIKV